MQNGTYMCIGITINPAQYICFTDSKLRRGRIFLCLDCNAVMFSRILAQLSYMQPLKLGIMNMMKATFESYNTVSGP